MREVPRISRVLSTALYPESEKHGRDGDMLRMRNRRIPTALLRRRGFRAKVS